MEWWKEIKDDRMILKLFYNVIFWQYKATFLFLLISEVFFCMCWVCVCEKDWLALWYEMFYVTLYGMFQSYSKILV